MDIERRVFHLDSIEIREDDESGMIVGHAAVFNSPTEIFGFREVVAPGAFKGHKDNDVRALINHDPNLILGRNKAGTLELAEDSKGLAVRIDPPDTSYARDLAVSLRRGDISQMSFGFRVTKEEWEEGKDGEMDLRTLKEVELLDVSAVTYPAYPDTDVAQRHHAEVRDKWTAERLEQDAATKREQAQREREMQLADI